MSTFDQSPIRSAWALQDPLLTEYYDTEWGVPVRDERGVFERLTLEAFQSGLSWLTILRKRNAFREAFDGFDPELVAAYSETDVERLLENVSIIRNRSKIEATIANARAMVALHRDDKTLSDIVWNHMPETSPTPHTDAEVPSTSPESLALAKALKRVGFKFVGPTTMYALMSALGVVDVHIVDSHRRGCSGLWNTDGTRVAA
ncbi:MAG: DNA-3-methyladenine glycosylase I [Leucobacter sp.]